MVGRAAEAAAAVALVSEAGFGPPGTYTVELQTDRAPYGVTVPLHHLDKPFGSTDFSAPPPSCWGWWPTSTG